jgi:asparagine synthase (glutamine-hydrolysing)
MCGIFAQFSETKPSPDVTTAALEALKHRGPDVCGKTTTESFCGKAMCPVFCTFAHTRLKIRGDDSAQPYETEDLILVINGEIFNYKELEKQLGYTCTMSDCEIVMPLYLRYGADTAKHLRGQFSFVLYDKVNNMIYAARDHVGITPMYVGNSILNTKGKRGVTFASEMKALLQHDNIDVFPPRSFVYQAPQDILDSGLVIQQYLSYYAKRKYLTYSNLSELHSDIYDRLNVAVERQLDGLSSNTFGVLLSGGLDSSLIASLISLKTEDRIKTFSIGTSAAAPDLVFARQVAQYIGSEHREYYYSVEEGIGKVPDVVRAVESYDVTTVRASTPMYILSQRIKADFPEIKVLFSGEGSDELFGGYLYFGNAPSAAEFGNECIRRVSALHLADCQRANKSCMAHSLETRVPFLDEQFVEFALAVDPAHKVFGRLNTGVMEKQILRDSFPQTLPYEVLYRQKEQFSDGIGYNWIDSLQHHAKALFSNDVFKTTTLNFKYNTPQTKEALWYRELFFDAFGKGSNTVQNWMPRWSANLDPSGRVQQLHNQLHKEVSQQFK